MNAGSCSEKNHYANPLVLYDTTLRDGNQTVGVSFDLKAKLKITRILSDFGFDYIEGGWPGANKTDTEYFRKVRELDIDAKISAFGMTAKTRKNIDVLHPLLKAEPDVFTVFGKAWDLHVKGALKVSLDEYLDAVRESVRKLKETGKKVIFDAEHFFDGYKNNTEYAMEVMKMAEDSGADALVLCDTNGGCFPWEIYSIVKETKKRFSIPLGIHCHNDGGLALANTLMAINAGVVHIQGTINGLGERCGNLDFIQLIPSLYKKGAKPGNMKKLYDISKNIGRISGFRVPDNHPYTGTFAFAHKGGVHAHAVLKNQKMYEHINPDDVGNVTWFPLSEQSGRSVITAEAERFGFSLKKNSPVTAELLRDIKESGSVGDVQFYLMLEKRLGKQKDPFELIYRKVVDDSSGFVEAEVKIKVNKKTVKKTCRGDGPVNATANALRKALEKPFPEIYNFRLVDYRVTLPGSEKGTEALVRVAIVFSDRGQELSSIAKDADILKASEKALVDGYKYYLLNRGANR